MSSNSSIKRDGFTSEYGRFCTVRGRIQRQDGASLRSMFLPKLTPAGQRTLRDHRDFVRGQLQHYDVAFEEPQFTGNGTQLMKKALQAGKCDTVPPHILEMEMQMHRDWLDTCTIEQLSHDPQWIIEKHFGSARQPDRTITTTVLGVPFPWSSEYRVSLIQNAASKVAGLHHEIGQGPSTKTVFVGWDKAAGYAAKKKKELQAAKKERETERAKSHADYRRQARKVASPVGSYMIDCREIEEQWPDQAEDLYLDIDATGEPGVFKAEFDFGVLEGVMILCADKAILERYCSQGDEPSEDEYEWDEESLEEDVFEDEKPKVGSKRKAPAPQRGGGSKKSKNTPARTFLVKMRGRETGEGEIMDVSKNGTITFKDGQFASFMGKADMALVGTGVVFTARKVSDTSSSQGAEWADYSGRQHERERVSRWH
ncbi:hypothetical protein P170DRAFT_397971 [Aspergillus steynii IBT 23096]|uniref:AT hook motif family protein n=1 Tax=Aspergillus steynii IBT 23096 TaxID=1392250 RepID=A0A2I2GNL3_9EURO|nr:uncharacterized protein P170DRAFT_397971 [Aspergillus steynii IBT 23096]PLB54467.1 hypothetical protein P170DRAFT_397971 [Aspergillus steynii IBT 23096]